MTLDSDGNSTGVFDFYPDAGSVVDMRVSPTDGSLYYLTYIPAALYRITYSTGNLSPTASASADVTSGLPPLTVNFTSSGTFDPNGDSLIYLWDFGDGSKSSEAHPTHSYTTSGRYTVQLKVSDASSYALAFPFIVQVGAPPDLTINLPPDNSSYKAGDTITYDASATDSSGTSLPDSAFTIEILFHHQTHIHPFLGPLRGNRSGNFQTPLRGEPSADTWFEIIVTAQDASGLATKKSVVVKPLVVNFSVATEPSGLQIFLDGIPTNAQTMPSVVNFQREVSVPAFQELGGSYYILNRWSDNGPMRHNINIPPNDSTLTAYFDLMPSFTGQYFNNNTLSEPPAFTREDKIIDFDWSGGSPGAGIGSVNYSVRWVNNINFMPGEYTFQTLTDDGVRFYIDGNLLIDQWHDQAPIPYSTTVDLSGLHEIKMEYYQSGGGAVAKLNWKLSTASPTPTPTPSLTPTPTPTPPSGDNLLSSPWNFTGNNSASEKYQTIDPSSLSGKDTLTLTYDLNGLCLLGGDASAIIFDQGGQWHYISLSDYGQNCFDGEQTVNIPLSSFLELDKSLPVGAFHGRFWHGSAFNVDVTDALLKSGTVTTTPTPTPTPLPDDNLLLGPWNFTGNNSASEKYQSVEPESLNGKDTLTLTYDLNGLCILNGDASAIIFDQAGEWHYVSLSEYGNNCFDGEQTVSIPLSDFPGLSTVSPVDAFHGRFWHGSAFSLDISKAVLSNGAPTPTPSGLNILTSAWNLRGNNSASEAYQAVDPNVLQGFSTLNLTYDLHGLCVLDGDASAIIFDQGGEWHYVSLSRYGRNCSDGTQTVAVPLSEFPGLSTSLPVGSFHARFWHSSPFAVDINSAVLFQDNVNPAPQ